MGAAQMAELKIAAFVHSNDNFYNGAREQVPNPQSLKVSYD